MNRERVDGMGGPFFRVRDLDAMVAQLRAAGIVVGDEIVEEDGVGRFAWTSDPEGTVIELWDQRLSSRCCTATVLERRSSTASRGPEPI
jgi:predicted enzyme related to lactoylglutathione lyase